MHIYIIQVVSPLSPIYIYDHYLKQGEDIQFNDNNNIPVIGIYKNTLGYNICEIYIDEQTIYIYERLTEDALKMFIETTTPIKIYSNIELPSFLRDRSDNTEIISGYIYENYIYYDIVLKRICEYLNINECLHSFRYVNNNNMDDNTDPLQQRATPIYISTGHIFKYIIYFAY